MSRRGFTLVELLVVITIIGILATLLIVSLTPARQKAKDSQLKTNLRTIVLAVERYAFSSPGGTYPANQTVGEHEAITPANLGDELNPNLGSGATSEAWNYQGQTTAYEAGERNLSYALFVNLFFTADNGPSTYDAANNMTFNDIEFEQTGLVEGRVFAFDGPN